jgi:hypothetical protein
MAVNNKRCEASIKTFNPQSARFKFNTPKKADPRSCLIESKRRPLPQKPFLFKPQFHQALTRSTQDL